MAEPCPGITVALSHSLFGNNAYDAVSWLYLQLGTSRAVGPLESQTGVAQLRLSLLCLWLSCSLHSILSHGHLNCYPTVNLLSRMVDQLALQVLHIPHFNKFKWT